MNESHVFVGVEALPDFQRVKPIVLRVHEAEKLDIEEVHVEGDDQNL